MPYALADVELAAPLPAVPLGAGDTGVGVLVRRHGRPVGFVLRALPPGTRLEPDALAELIAGELRVALVREAVREELRPPAAAPALDVTVLRGRPTDRALRAAATPWVAFVAPGAELDAGWREGLAEAVAEQPDAAAVTGLVLPRALPTEAAVAFERAGGLHLGFEKRRFAGERAPDVPFHPVDTRALGARGNLALRRDAALAAGARGGEGALLFALLRAGHALAYEPRMLVRHAGAGDAGTGARGDAAGALLRVALSAPELRGRAARAAAWRGVQAAKERLRGR